MRRARKTRRMRRMQGSASVEIVVMLPVFISLFAGVLWLHRSGSAVQSAGAMARGCAWAHALQGCPDTLPEVCSELGVRSKAHGGEVEQLEDTGWFGTLNSIPVLGAAVRGVFGHAHIISASVSNETFAGEAATSSSRQYVLCNVVAQTWGDHLHALKDAVLNW